MDRLRYRETVSPGCGQVGGGVDELVDAVQVPSYERRRGEGPFGDVNEGVRARHVASAVSEQPVACVAKGVGATVDSGASSAIISSTWAGAVTATAA